MKSNDYVHGRNNNPSAITFIFAIIMKINYRFIVNSCTDLSYFVMALNIILKFVAPINKVTYTLY